LVAVAGTVIAASLSSAASASAATDGAAKTTHPGAVSSELAPGTKPSPAVLVAGAPQGPGERESEQLNGSSHRKSPDLSKARVVSESADRRVWQQPDGTQVAQINPVPVRVRKGAGWQDVDLSLASRADGRVGPKVPLVDVSFGASSAEPLGQIVADDSSVLSLAVERAVPGTPAESIRGGLAQRFDNELPGGTAVEIEAARFGEKTTYEVPSSAAASPIVERLALPGGWTARQNGDAIDVVDSAGQARGSWVGGPAFDATGTVFPGTVTMQLLDLTDGVARAEVSSGDWMNDPSRAFPVRLDPGVVLYTQAAGAGDSWVRSGSPNQNAWSDPYLYAGVHPSLHDVWRSVLTFQDTLPPNSDIHSAELQLLESNGSRTPTGTMAARRNTSGWGPAVTWATAPYGDAANQGVGSACCAGDQLVDFDITTYARQWHGSKNGLPGLNAPNYGITLLAENEADDGVDRYFAFHSGESAYVPQLTIFYDPAPAAPPQNAPADGVTVLTTSPTLTTDQSVIQEERTLFQIATGADGESGEVVTSGWTTNNSWTPPDGELADGATYYWKVYRGFFPAGATVPTAVSRAYNARKFQVNLRLGTSTTSPTDTYGPVSVNLATGNVTTSVGLLSEVSALGGSMGLKLTYNSQTPSRRGLIGEYFQDPGATHNYSVASLAARRRDSEVSFDWGGGSPTPAVDLDSTTPGDHFMVRWRGYVTLAAGNNWDLGIKADDGARIYFDNNTTSPIADNGWGASPTNTTTYWSGALRPERTRSKLTTTRMPAPLTSTFTNGLMAPPSSRPSRVRTCPRKRRLSRRAGPRLPT
jgi:hypothetical protein